MDKIREKQYRNLRECVNKNLVVPILGENYYNYGDDVYTADRLTTEDIRHRYDKAIRKTKISSILLKVSLVTNLLLTGSAGALWWMRW